MAESERKSTLPAILIVILAMLGLTKLPGSLNSTPSSDSGTAKTEKKPLALAPSPAASSRAERESQVLDPLVEHFKTKADQPYTGTGGLLEDIKRKTAHDRHHPLKCLIAILPDPVRSTNSHRFDEYLDAIQRGVESQGYILDRYRLPWGDDETKSSAPDKTEPTTQTGQTAGPLRKTAKPPPTSRQPGAVLFRKNVEAVKPLLLVFLVPETPTLGLDKTILTECLALASRWDSRNRGDNAKSKGGKAKINILGPSFSGSQDSLEHALRDWKEGKPENVEFNIISGSASAIDVEGLQACLHPENLGKDRVRFRATLHRDETVLRALLNHVGQDEPLALLIESDTGFGNQSAPQEGLEKSQNVAENTYKYYFPSNISYIRGYYDEKGQFQDPMSQTFRSVEQLAIPFEQKDGVTDIIEPRTPAFTSAIDELVLDQILTDIARRKIRKVGIIATDPRDVIFLAREVRQFCPDAQLFTTACTLLFIHPQQVGDLRGMIVGSTYPLYPHNQAWSFPYKNEAAQIFFSSSETQGTYNATVAQLEEMEIRDENKKPQFLEYGSPFDAPGTTGKTIPRMPPIWISAIGYHGIYPVKIADPENSRSLKSAIDKDDQLYLYKYQQDESDFGARELGQSRGFELKLMRAVNNAIALPAKGKNQIIVADVQNVLHFRIFDGDGEKVVDTNEKKLTKQAPQIKELKKQLKSLWSCPELTRSEKDHVNAAVTLIIEDTYGRIRDRFLPHFENYWVILFVGLSVSGLALAFTVFLAVWWSCRETLEPRDAALKLGPINLAPLAEFLNLVWAEEAEKRSADRCRGPGLYLGLTLLLLIPVYATICRPLLWSVARVGWMPLQAGYEVSWFATAAFLTLGFMTAAFVVSGIVWFKQRLVSPTPPPPGAVGVEGQSASASPRNGRKPIGFPTVLLLSVFALFAIPGILLFVAKAIAPDVNAENFKDVKIYKLNYLIRFDRSMQIPSGVSPVLPMLFLGLGSCAWVYYRLKSRYIDEQCTPPGGKPIEPEIGAVNREVFKSLYKKAEDLEKVQKSYWRNLLELAYPLHLILMLLFLGIFLLPMGRVFGFLPIRTYDGPVFEWIFGVLFIFLFITLTFHSLRLLMMWRRIHEIMGLVLRLPLTGALDRLPAHVAGWFFATPKPGGGRFDLIQRQCAALAERCDKVREEVRALGIDTTWSAELGTTFDEKWKKLKSILTDADRYRNDLPLVRQVVVSILGQDWKTLSVVEVFPNPPTPGEEKAATGQLGEIEALLKWKRLAEDLLALLFMRWLGSAMAQIWMLIGYLVIGSLALLFALSSYPFPYQSRFIQGVGLLILFLIVVIVLIVLGINRNEVVSRVANTSPNRIKLDGNLFTNLFTYVVPLVGVLAALSFDLSDSLRALFDPILSHLR